MRYNFVSEVVGVKNVNKPEPDKKTSMLESTIQALLKKLYLKSTKQLIKTPNF